MMTLTRPHIALSLVMSSHLHVPHCHAPCPLHVPPCLLPGPRHHTCHVLCFSWLCMPSHHAPHASLLFWCFFLFSANFLTHHSYCQRMCSRPLPSGPTMAHQLQ